MKNYFLILTFSILCLFISCETHVIEDSFDSDSYNSNLEQWKQSDLKNYQFEFTTDYRDSGIYYVGVVTVIDGVSYVKFPESYNSPFRKTENYPSYFKNINSVESLFNLISNYSEKYDNDKSVSFNISYSEYHPVPESISILKDNSTLLSLNVWKFKELDANNDCFDLELYNRQLSGWKEKQIKNYSFEFNLFTGNSVFNGCMTVENGEGTIQAYPKGSEIPSDLSEFLSKIKSMDDIYALILENHTKDVQKAVEDADNPVVVYTIDYSYEYNIPLMIDGRLVYNSAEKNEQAETFNFYIRDFVKSE